MGQCAPSTEESNMELPSDDMQHIRRQQHQSPQQQQQRRGGPQQTTHQTRRRPRTTATLQSLVRVGSTMFKSVLVRDPESGKVTKTHKPTNQKAETYDHVHDAVNETLSARHSHHGEKNNNGGTLLNQVIPKTMTTTTTRTVGVVGLQNLGNTCFMNSSLQCLSHTIPLTDYFLGYDYRKEINHENFLGTKGELANAYAVLMKEMWLSKKKSLAPSSFKASLGHFAPQFAGYDQHDCQELLAFLLDGIHEDLNRVKKRPYIEDKDCDGTNDTSDSMDAWENYLKRNKSIVVDLFQGQLRNTMKCCNTKIQNADGSTGCGHRNVKFDSFMYLSLPMQDDCQTLDDCLELFCTVEHLTGANQWYCSKCKEHVDATKKFDLWMLPPILVVHLKRFRYNDYGARSKLNRKMNYPVCNWSLDKFIKSSENAHEMYDLYAVTNHYGNLGGGHYTASAMNRFDNQWYEFNDSTCTKVDQSRLGNDNAAYCLFYNRMEKMELENDEEKEDSFRRAAVRRQSVSKPELWPHMQNAAAKKKTKVDVRKSFRDFHKVSMMMLDQLDDTLIMEEEGSEGDMEKMNSNIEPLDDTLVEEQESEGVVEEKKGKEEENSNIEPLDDTLVAEQDSEAVVKEKKGKEEGSDKDTEKMNSNTEPSDDTLVAEQNSEGVVEEEEGKEEDNLNSNEAKEDSKHIG
mmetsp:Transcript_16921/g.23942  ORF Transcript_16921/g.23942 Transcript_16921/m.23942 type:complete len:685 (-) Transcript_16921:63-2117(-)